MEKDQEEKLLHACKFCKQSFSNGKKLGGHMRSHLALISVIRKKSVQDSINGEKGLDHHHMIKQTKGFIKNDQDFDGGYKMVKKSQHFCQDYGANGRRNCNQEVVNGTKGKMVKKSQLFDQGYGANGRIKGSQESDQEVVNGEKGLKFDDDYDKMVKKCQRFAYCSNGRKKGNLGSDQEVVNGENGFGEYDDDGDGMVKKSQQEMDVDQDYDDQEYGANNVYGLRENPKRSWRVSSSISDFGIFCKECGKEFDCLKALASHRRCHLRNESVSIKNNVCEKCGKGFDSMKALYGHMRCHSAKRSQLFDASEDDASDDDGGLANPVRKKRSCKRYKSPKPNHASTSLSSCYGDYEVEEGAICLMMLSRGIRNEVKLVISHEAEFALSGTGYGSSRTLENSVEFDVSVDGLVKFGKFKNKTDLGLKRDLTADSGSSQVSPGRVRSTVVKCKSTMKPRTCDQDFGDRDDTDSKISFGLKRRSKNHICAICFKEFGSKQALGSHKRVHNKTANKTVESDAIPNIHRFVDLNRGKGGVKNSDVEFKLTWVHREIDWDPFAVVN